MGRPSKRTPEIEARLIDGVSNGVPMAEVCREDGMPHPSTVRDWMAADESFSLAIARAREDGEDRIAADCLRIADTPVEGVIEKYEQVPIPNPDDPEGEATTEFRITERRVEDMLSHRKLQIDTRLKLLSKWNPKKWGDKLALAGDADSPLTVVVRKFGE